MLFNSLTFAAFCVCFFPVYFLLPLRGQHAWTLAASYFFYAWWDWRFLSLLFASTLFTYLVNIRLGNCSEQKDRRFWLVFGISANLAILFVFKYFNFFVSSAGALLQQLGFSDSTSTLSIVLPIGISFYTFHAINYQIDTYRGKIGVERSLLRYAVYIALWPQLVAGPIVRAARLLPQLRTRKKFRWANFSIGMELVVIGFFLKVVLADNLGPVANLAFAQHEALSAISLFCGAIFFSFQIYGDFAGYSMIAIGFGRIMGLNLGINFRRPYMSSSFSEFWTRWHISLSSWLRDYLYISLGGNRGGKFKEYRNLMATMVLGGLWHGANWTFVMWGAMHGAMLILQRMLGGLFRSRNREGQVGGSPLTAGVSKTLAIILVFTSVTLAWIPFRADNFSDALGFLRGLFGPDWDPSSLNNKVLTLLGSFLILIVVACEIFREFSPLYQRYRRQRMLRAAVITMIAAVIPLLGNFHGASFIYFQF